MKTTLHLHRHVPPAPAPRVHIHPTTVRLGLVLSLVAAVLAIVIEAVIHLPAILILIPVVIVGFALSWRASGSRAEGRR
jgi:hypothetical protein